MKIPSWSAFLIVPAMWIIAGSPVVIRSDNPGKSALVLGITAIIVAILAWGMLALFDKVKR